MKTSQSKPKLTSNVLFRESRNMRTNLAVLSFYEVHFPHIFELFAIIIEYFQLFAQMILQASEVVPSYDALAVNFSYLLYVFLYFLKVFDVGHLIDYENDSLVTVSSIAMGLLYMIIVFCLSFYAISVIKWNLNPSNIAISIWRWALRFHGQVFFYFMSSVCFNALRQLRLGTVLSTYGNDSFVFVSCLILLIGQFAMAILLWVKHSLILPSKSFAACKSHTPEIMTITQKCTLGIVYIFMPKDSFTGFWTLVVLNLLFSLIKGFHYFRVFPNYNLKALFLKGNFIAMEISVNIIMLLRGLIISTTKRELSTLFTIGTSLIVMPFVLRIVSSVLTKDIVSLLTMPCNSMKPEKLLHKIMIIKQVRTHMKNFNKFSQTNDFFYFLYHILLKNINDVFHLGEESHHPSSSEVWELYPNKLAYKVIVLFLTNLSKRHPRSELIKLYLAYFYGIKLRNYGIAIQIIKDVETQSRSPKCILNASLITYGIQKIITRECFKNTKPLDIMEYIQNLDKVFNIESKILDQSDLQASLYQEHRSSSPNLMKFIIKAQQIESLRQAIRRDLSKFLGQSPDYNLEPLLVFASYELILNYNDKDYLTYLKTYMNKYNKYMHKFKGLDLNQENLFHHDRVFFTVSAQREKSGVIQYASKSTRSILGWDNKLINGSNLSRLLPGPLQKHYSSVLKNYVEADSQNIFGSTDKSFVLHKNGAIIQVDQYFQIHPFVHDGLYINMVFRPIPTTKDHLIVSKEGNIEGFTENIGKKLGLFTEEGEKINISSLSKEFQLVNYVFNLLASPIEGSSRSLKTDHKIKPVVRLSAIGKLKGSFRRISIKKNNVVNGKLIPGEDAKRIYDLLSGPGKTFCLHKVDEDLNFSVSKNIVQASSGSRQTVTGRKGSNVGHMYQCHVKNWYLGANLLKIFTLEKVEMDQDVSGEPGSALHMNDTYRQYGYDQRLGTNITIPSPAQYSPLLGTPPMNNADMLFNRNLQIHDREDIVKRISLKKERALRDIEELDAGEEKDGGWIDISRLSSERRVLMLKSSLVTGTREYIESKQMLPNLGELQVRYPENPEKQERTPNFSRTWKKIKSVTKLSIVPQSANRRRTGEDVNLDDRLLMIKKNTFGVRHEEKEEGSKEVNDEEKAESSSNNFENSGGVVYSKGSKVIRESLDIKYYSRSYILCVAIFYVFILWAFGVQVFLEYNFNDYVQDLNVRKEALRLTDRRSDAMINVQRIFRMLWIFKAKKMSPLELGMPPDVNAAFVPAVLVTLQQLSDINQELSMSLSFMDKADRNEVFRDDVKVFDTYFQDSQQEFFNLTSFQAAQRVIEDGYKVAFSYNSNMSKLTQGFNFIFRNAFNEFLLKSDSMMDIILHSLDDIKQSTLNIIRVYLGLSLLVLMCCFVGGLIMIVRRYKDISQKMKAFIRLNEKAVMEVQTKIQTFMRVIREGEYIECLHEFLDVQDRTVSRSMENAKSSGMNSAFKKTNSDSLRRKFYIHAVNLTIMLMCLMVVIVLNFILFDRNVGLFQKELDQLLFTYNLKTNIVLTSSTILELFAEGGATFVKGIPAPTELEVLSNKLIEMRGNIAGVYIKSDDTYDSTIELILFRDSCQVVDPTKAIICKMVKAGAQDASLLSLMSTLQNGARGFVDNFLSGNSSQAKIDKVSMLKLYPLVATIEAVNAALVATIDNNFRSFTQEALDRSRITFGVVYPTTIIMCVLLWYVILRSLGETTNEFKNVLKILPPNLLATNFVLKSFIIRASKGTINSNLNET